MKNFSRCILIIIAAMLSMWALLGSRLTLAGELERSAMGEGFAAQTLSWGRYLAGPEIPIIPLAVGMLTPSSSQ